MIKEDQIINEWKIYSAENFKEEFNIKEKKEDDEFDEDYIIQHLKEDPRTFRVTFMEDPRNNTYEEYWLIQEVEDKIKDNIKIKDRLESILVDIKERHNIRDFDIEEETDKYWDWLY